MRAKLLPVVQPGAIEQARHIPPVWAGWICGLFQVFAAFLLSVIVAAIVAAIAIAPFRRSTTDLWTEKARLAYRARAIAGRNTVLLPIVLALLPAAGASPPWRILTIAAVAVAAYAGALWVAVRVERRVRGISSGWWWRRFFTFWIALRPHWLVAAAIALAMPGTMTARAWILLALGALVLNFCADGIGLQIGLRIGLLRRADASVSAIVQRVAAEMGVPVPPTYVMHSALATVFAWPDPPALIWSESALMLLDEEETAAVCAHELGHLLESRLERARRTASVFFLLPIAAARPLIGSLGLGQYVAFLSVLVVLGVFGRRWSRRMEARADSIAKTHAPAAYPRALAKIYEFSLLPAVLSGMTRSHPDLYDRLLAAGVTPSYSRPAPPSRVAIHLLELLTIAIAAAGSLGVQMLLLRCP